MADKKISQLTELTDVPVTSVIPMSYNGSTYKVKLETILDSLGKTGKVSLGGITSETVAGGGITESSFISKVSGVCSLGPFSPGVIKFITATDNATVNVTGGNGFISISLTTNQTALLLYFDAWYIVSTNGVIV